VRAWIIGLAVLIAVLPTTSDAADSPDRAKGISMHMLPKRVADISGDPWGLTVSYAKYLAPEPAQPVVQSAAEFLTYVRKQSSTVQSNGVWIVTTDPDSYSHTEKALLEEIKSLCRKEGIPLFIARGSELPGGWRRYDIAP
jgi:hypothetical protein